MASFKRTPQTPLADIPGSLPVCQIKDTSSSELHEIASSVLSRFPDLHSSHLASNAVWRDSLAVTGTFRTFYNPDSILIAWDATKATHRPTRFVLREGSARVMRIGEKHAWIEAGFTFEASTADGLSLRCSGFLSLVPDDSEEGEWKVWMLRTLLEGVQGWGDVDSLAVKEEREVNGMLNGEKSSYEAIVVGGGQAGLATGARLQALGVDAVIVDKLDNVGDCWRLRYDSVKLHTSREYGHLPFSRNFGPQYPEFLTKDHLADAHQEFVKKYGINYLTSMELVSALWSEEEKLWTCQFKRNGEDVILKTQHLIFAIGPGGQTPLIPEYPNRDKFQGTVIHSVDYKTAIPWKGKRGAVIGSANTAHDVAEDMVDADMKEVTMIQRGRTWVFPIAHYMAVTTPLYNERIPTDLADRMSFSQPITIHRQIALKVTHAMARRDYDQYVALEKAGFNVEPFGDFAHILYERLGGHYLDVGASAKIAQGLIKVKSRVIPTHWTSDGLVFNDGTELKADVFVFSTGFIGNVRQTIEKIVGSGIGQQLEDFWGCDAEGELRGAFKPMGHPGLWCVGGTIGHARYYTRYVALQVKAALLGTPFPRYADRPKDHLITV